MKAPDRADGGGDDPDANQPRPNHHISRYMETTSILTINAGPILAPDLSHAIIPAMSTEPEKPEDFATLYRRAFKDFGASALWSSRPVPDPTPADALAITRTLRVEGDLRARKLAEQIERACRDAPR